MIKLELSIEEANVILNALGTRPYGEVFQLINKIQQQAQGQLAETPENGTKNPK